MQNEGNDGQKQKTTKYAVRTHVTTSITPIANENYL
jgi:hypothetical protein